MHEALKEQNSGFRRPVSCDTEDPKSDTHAAFAVSRKLQLVHTPILAHIGREAA